MKLNSNKIPDDNDDKFINYRIGITTQMECKHGGGVERHKLWLENVNRIA
jgi:hypothetical protein